MAGTTSDKVNPKPMGKLVVLAWQVERLAGATAPTQVVEHSNESTHKAMWLIPAVAKKLFSAAGRRPYGRLSWWWCTPAGSSGGVSGCGVPSGARVGRIGEGREVRNGEWATWVSRDEACARSAGRRRLNSIRKLKARVRQQAVLRRLCELGMSPVAACSASPPVNSASARA